MLSNLVATHTRLLFKESGAAQHWLHSNLTTHYNQGDCVPDALPRGPHVHRRSDEGIQREVQLETINTEPSSDFLKMPSDNTKKRLTTTEEILTSSTSEVAGVLLLVESTLRAQWGSRGQPRFWSSDEYGDERGLHQFA